MSDAIASDLEVIKLWSCVFLEKDLQDYEEPTERLCALAESRAADGVFAIDDPAVHWLKQHVAHAVSAYLQRSGYTRVAMNMNAIKRDPYHRYHQSLRPRPGLLLLWPAYVSYFMHPNTSREPAVRVAFEVRLQAGQGSA